MSKIHIVIVNYRTTDHVVDCLRSLEPELNETDFSVTVVDVDSRDSAADRLDARVAEQAWSRWVRVVAVDHNGGFAYANNLAIERALAGASSPEYVMLLNPDTTVRRGAVRELATFLDDHADVGIVGSQLLDSAGEFESSARRSPGIWSELAGAARLGVVDRLLQNKLVSLPLASQPVACDWVSGAAMMVRQQVFRDIGLLDAGYFLYFEELDFCDRARRAGWGVWQLPNSRVVHLEGAATQLSVPDARRPAYWYQSRRRYFIRHHGTLFWLAADAAWALGRLSLLFRRALRLGGSTQGDPDRFMWDLLGGDLRALISGEFSRAKQGR